ncbi:lipopolysaccharide biosynthesis protein [Gelidibacter sp. DF109]|uniref:Lipopolysaccharide biosynthesis protein n=2 Tax=Gelidibacter pelagius TaxID=2819985 RepID=A0ABS3SWS1_9FLAO|nr:lipopolysaccharide biosynthesis protein [Gelidibacter pelagius]
MGVGLYTSRLVLDALGVVDYGIYNLVGGIVTMFAFLNSAMASSGQRYLSFDIGKNDLDRLQKTFNATLNIHFLIALIILIMAETVGLWFVFTKLEIPDDRIIAAHWVYQFSVFTLILNVVQVPYNALLIAREHMNVYAYVSVLDNVLKLLVVLILIRADSDRLILYAILTFCIAFIIRFIYKIYCKNKFKESVYKFYYDKEYYKELINYSSWNLFGSIAAIASGQGSNVLLNLFFGPVANAAYSLTLVVQNVIGGFIRNFQIALNPQIIKNYAQGDSKASLNLIYKSAKFSFFGMLILILPFLYNIEYVMNLWLKEIPPYSIDFIKLALIYAIIETISNPLIIGAHATGKMKWYQIIIGSLIFLTLPITWIVFNLSNNPINVYWVLIGNSIIALVFRMLFLVKMIGLNIKSFILQVLLRIVLVSFVMMLLLSNLKLEKADNIYNLLFQVIFVFLTTTITISVLGLNNQERLFLTNIIKTKFFKK